MLSKSTTCKDSHKVEGHIMHGLRLLMFNFVVVVVVLSLLSFQH